MVTYSWLRSEKKTSASDALAGQAHGVVDLRAGDGGAQCRPRRRGRRRRRAQTHDVLDRDVERERVAAAQGTADGLRDASPVRVPAVQRGLDQRRVGHRAGGEPAGVLVRAGDDDAAGALRPLAVADDQQRELAQDGVEREPELRLVLRLRLDLHAALAAAHEDRGVVGRELAVDGDAVEGALHAHAEQQVGGGAGHLRVRLDEAQHGREVGLDHPRALALGGEVDDAAAELDGDRDLLGEGVGRPDRLGEGRVVAAELAAGGEQAFGDLVAVELDADDAGGGDGDLVLRDARAHRAGALHLRRGVHPPATGGGVGVAGVDRDGAQGARASRGCA